MSLIKQSLIKSSRARRLAGYALLEAMVAVIVTSVGFIGAARMQTLGVKMNASTQLRQKAVLLTYQMTDRIRANQTGFTTGAYNNPEAGSASCLSTAGGCSPTDLAAADMTEWTLDVAAQLPGGVGVVCIDSTPDDGSIAAPACDGVGNLLAVKVWWTDSVGASEFTTSVRP